MKSFFFSRVTIVAIILIVPVQADAAERGGPGPSRTAFSPAEAAADEPARSLPGIVVPIRQVTITSAREGILQRILVKEGQQVAVGELLAQMDDRVALAAVALSRAAANRTAQIDHAREEQQFAENLVWRLETLQIASKGSDFELFEARSRLVKAKATLASAMEAKEEAERQLDLEQARLDQLSIRAPFAGQVVRVDAYPGVTVTRDDPILTIVRLDLLKVELHLPLALYDRLQTDHSYALRAGPPIRQPITGRLTYITPVVDAATATFRAVFQVDNRQLRFPAGFSVQFDPTQQLTLPPGRVPHPRPASDSPSASP